MRLDREKQKVKKNLAARELGSLCQFVQTEEARVAAEGQVTGDLTDHTYVTVVSLYPPAAEGMDTGCLSWIWRVKQCTVFVHLNPFILEKWTESETALQLCGSKYWVYTHLAPVSRDGEQMLETILDFTVS